MDWWKVLTLWEVTYKCQRLAPNLWNNWQLPVWEDRTQQQLGIGTPELHDTKNSSLFSRLHGHWWDPKAASTPQPPLQGRPVRLLLPQWWWGGGVAACKALGLASVKQGPATVLCHPETPQLLAEEHGITQREVKAQMGWHATRRITAPVDHFFLPIRPPHWQRSAHIWNYTPFALPNSSQFSQVRV